MNVVSKGSLRSLFSDNKPRVGNGQRGSTGLGLVYQWIKGSSDKARLNILRAEDVRRVEARSSTEQDDKAGTRGDNEAGIGGDNKPGKGRPDDKPGTRRRDNKLGTRGQDDKRGIRDETTNQAQKDKTATEWVM